MLQLVSGQAVGTLFDLEESKYMQERMEAEAQYQGKQTLPNVMSCVFSSMVSSCLMC